MAFKFTNRFPPFTAQHLESICRMLAHTDEGLTGAEIGYILADCQIGDPDPSLTKWHRLFNAFVKFQNTHQVGNHVLVFITRAMTPARYTKKPHVFEERRRSLNEILAFCGFELQNDGRIRQVDKATNLNDALTRANKLRLALEQRGVHADVLRFCNAEILAQNYFHAVFEAMKSVTAKLRDLSGLTSDGAELVEKALGLSSGNMPIIRISDLSTETLKGEQRGFVSLLRGLYGTIRNPLAHNPKVEWDMNEQDTLDILTMLSLVHRKLDKAQRIIP